MAKTSVGAPKGEKQIFEANPPHVDDAMTCEYEVLNENTELPKFIESPPTGSMFLVSHGDDADELRELAMF